MADGRYVNLEEAAEANQLLAEAESSIRCQCWPWVKEQRCADAAELFKSAGSKYTRLKMYQQAGVAYIKAGRCHLRLTEPYEAAEMFSRACISYKNIPEFPYEEIIGIYIEAITLYEDTDNPGKAAKLLQDVGVFEEERGDWQKAAEAYEEAATLLFTETKEAQAYQLQLKVADICMANAQYTKGAELFEKAGVFSAASPMLRWSVTTYFFKAMLCLIALEAFHKPGDTKKMPKSPKQAEKSKTAETETEAEGESKHSQSDSDSEVKEEPPEELGTAYAALERFEEQHPPSAGSREFKLVEELITCYHARDLAGFETAIANFNAFVYMDKPALALFKHMKAAPIWTEQPNLQ